MASTVQTTGKISVFLRNVPNAMPKAAKFSRCLVDYFSPSGSETYVHLEESVAEKQMILSSSTADNKNCVLLVHPPTCPIRRLSNEEAQTLDQLQIESNRRFGAAVSAIIESSDEHILLTRRAKTLRSFPGLWVGPGGHIDAGESAVEAIIREADEETGLGLSEMPCQIKILHLWESAFPSSHVKKGALPLRHDLVIYYHVKLPVPSSKLGNFSVSFHEVDLIGWIPKQAAMLITAPKQEPNADVFLNVFACDIEKSIHSPTTIALAELTDTISAGTKFAISRWLACKDG